MAKTHGQSKTNLYKRWVGMRERCRYGYKQKSYKDTYIVREWDDFIVFEKWATENGYNEELELDKDIICTNKDIHPPYYGPNTCMWVTKEKNIKNSKNYLAYRFMNEDECGIRKVKQDIYHLIHKSIYIKRFSSMNEAVKYKKKMIMESKQEFKKLGLKRKFHPNDINITRELTMFPQKIRNNNKSGQTGVSFVKERNLWLARITINKVIINIGGYKNVEDAIIARTTFEQKIQSIDKNKSKQEILEIMKKFKI